MLCVRVIQKTNEPTETPFWDLWWHNHMWDEATPSEYNWTLCAWYQCGLSLLTVANDWKLTITHNKHINLRPRFKSPLMISGLEMEWAYSQGTDEELYYWLCVSQLDQPTNLPVASTATARVAPPWQSIFTCASLLFGVHMVTVPTSQPASQQAPSQCTKSQQMCECVCDGPLSIELASTSADDKHTSMCHV